ncbi:11058_t:CDS:2 [Funneliformis caledonium]|uniref:11058_t:CDS:1 n=2 Tax=Funneliformis TaxID=1117308 RepID=A0A9N8Z3J9_9GLOM|nr:592_t:CDS:2 [Funneliformis mosseae]CAG8470999.1 11058_t:CDS:2 [Funneliformis caledonium]
MSEDMLKDFVSRNVDVLVEETPQLPSPPPSSVKAKHSNNVKIVGARNNIQFQIE